MNIGFDLDKIFINFPPFVPSKIIDLFYKERTNHELKYRIPSKAEQIIRIFSHHPLLRFPITQNLNYLNNLALANNNKYYLISSRFGFLKNRTDNLIKRYRLDKIFKAMYFNYENKQPHQFKNEVIGKLNLGMYVDDDLQLLEYLIDKNPKTKFFWLNNKISKPLKKNLFAIKHLSEMFA
ncbi:MAG: hypothetical protein A3B47_04730 [Candidatus Levybacteria bacterium RIFCSPLOWO2_01_FULL_39_24]|nr:MAG: hypothetical protein A2800_04100 [Candidatus Levybacteria bacterium RIFCSPHIGHO2_01_FULL_40_16]OGH46750.1 MAG: hypothetical protein A3B47_04730 [Candidatus Levybacteria bacterium RIFCSPLOWO2_01_FULL_39_24]